VRQLALNLGEIRNWERRQLGLGKNPRVGKTRHGASRGTL
jgi:hypothetical protein